MNFVAFQVRDNLEQFDHDVANLMLLPALLGGNVLALRGAEGWLPNAT